MRLMGTAEIAELLGVSRQRAQQIASQRNFPKPLGTIKAGHVWRAADVEKWQAIHRPT